MVHLFLANGGPGGTNLDPLYDEALFWILAVLAVSAALAMILVRHAVHSALMLAVVMLCLAVMYAMQGAPFLAFVQVIVYTGAVLMLFLFVVMLIGTNSTESLVEVIRGQRLWAALPIAACPMPTMSSTARPPPARPAHSRWPLIVSFSESAALTPISMTTNRNSISTAPVYTMTWTKARNGASCMAYMTASESMTTASMSAQCTACRTTIMPTAAETDITARIQNRTVS